MKNAMLLVALVFLSACGGDGTEPIPRDPINLSGTFAAETLDGQAFPVEVGSKSCGFQGNAPEGTQQPAPAEYPLRISKVEVTFYDDNPDPSASEGVARSVEYEYGNCWQRSLEWGTYYARTDSILFTWYRDPPAFEDAEWDTSERTSFTSMVTLTEGEYLAVMRR